ISYADTAAGVARFWWIGKKAMIYAVIHRLAEYFTFFICSLTVVQIDNLIERDFFGKYTVIDPAIFWNGTAFGNRVRDIRGISFSECMERAPCSSLVTAVHRYQTRPVRSPLCRIAVPIFKIDVF